MKNFDIKEVVITLLCVAIVICGWISYAARPTDEAGTQAVLEKQVEWNEMAKNILQSREE